MAHELSEKFRCYSMRKLIAALSFFACFFCFYGLGAYLRTYPLSPGGSLFPATVLKRESSISLASKKPTLETITPPSKPVSQSILEDKGSKLIESLQASNTERFSNLRESVQQRFGNEYPTAESEALKEAADRMGILQALSQYSQEALSQDELQTLVQFYEQKTEDENEHPAVRRESARNLLQMIGRLDEEERLKILARSARFLSSASRPVNELLEKIFQVSTP